MNNVHPIYGVNCPEIEAKNYSTLVCRTVPLLGGFPAFDVVLLGAGDDGHTSSIFPGQEYLLSSFHPYEVSVNPYNGQKRIAMTGCLLFAAKHLIFFITGKNKADVVRNILDSGDATGPAAYVGPFMPSVWNCFSMSGPMGGDCPTIKFATCCEMMEICFFRKCLIHLK